MKSTIALASLFMIGMMIVIQSCTPAPATEVLTATQAARSATPFVQPPTTTPFVEHPTETPVIPATNAPTPTAQHTILPVSLPIEQASRAADFDSSKVSLKKPVVGGDRFTFEQFERPFNANTMDIYYPSLDIVSVSASQDDLWIYGTIQLRGREADRSLTRRYALELDLDHNGKGDWLVIASNPASTDWTVEGVQVYQDANQDVGNLSAMYTDKGASGDGYETLVFDQGVGTDPDAAWARTSPMDPNNVEISIKRSALGNPESYLIGMWAGSSALDPALFDLNDYFTHEQAGAADLSYIAYFPIKAVAEIDNTCRIAVGFRTGQENGLCRTARVGVGIKDGGSQTNKDPNQNPGGGSGGGGGEGGGQASCPPCPPGQSHPYPYPDCSCSAG